MGKTPRKRSLKTADSDMRQQDIVQAHEASGHSLGALGPSFQASAGEKGELGVRAPPLC